MDKKTIAIVAIALVLLVGIPILSRVKGGPPPLPASESTIPISAPGSSSSPTPPPPAAPGQPYYYPKQTDGAPVSAPSKANQPPPNAKPRPITAKDLANTAWEINTPQYGAVTVQLYANGQAAASGSGLPITVYGNWSVNGNSLVVSAMGQTISAQLFGDQLMANGMAARRVR